MNNIINTNPETVILISIVFMGLGIAALDVIKLYIKSKLRD